MPRIPIMSAAFYFWVACMLTSPNSWKVLCTHVHRVYVDFTEFLESLVYTRTHRVCSVDFSYPYTVHTYTQGMQCWLELSSWSSITWVVIIVLWCVTVNSTLPNSCLHSTHVHTVCSVDFSYPYTVHTYTQGMQCWLHRILGCTVHTYTQGMQCWLQLSSCSSIKWVVIIVL